MNELVTANPFSRDVAPVQAPISAPARTDQQRAVAEVQAAMMIARANPRDPVDAMTRIINACMRQTLAEKALYSFARGGSEVSGPSIRLAEAIAQQWGNINFGIRELEQSSTMSTVQAYAWDLETNTRKETTFQVPLIRHTKRGAYKLEDPRDVYEMVANQGARRLRACILAVVPGDVIDAAVDQCDKTLHAKADVGPEAQQKLVTAFGEYGVTKDMIERRIQRRLDAIQPAQMVALKKVYVSLRDGMSSPADHFEMAVAAAPAPAQASKVETLKEKVKAAATPASAPASAADAYTAGSAARNAGEKRDTALTGPDKEAWLAGWDAADEAMQQGK